MTIEEDKARLWQANQRAIVSKRLALARRLQAPPGPAAAVRAGWAAVMRTGIPRDPQLDPLVASVPMLPLSLRGATGPEGPAGPPGVGALDAAFTWDQVSPSALWVIVHNLNREPDVAVQIGGELVLADVSYPDLNTVVIEFPTPQTGQAVLN